MKAERVEPDADLVAFAGRNVDWSYAASLAAPVSADALDWARASFEGAPVPMRVFLLVGWTLLLLEGGLRSDAGHVLGWPIEQAVPDATVLRRRSPLGIHATLVFTTRDDRVTFASAMAYTSRLGQIVWAGVAPIHRWAVRFVLTRAASVIALHAAASGTWSERDRLRRHPRA